MSLVILVSCFAFLKFTRERSNERNKLPFLEFWSYIPDLAFDVLRRNSLSFVPFEKEEKTKSSQYHMQESDKEWRNHFYIRKVIFFAVNSSSRLSKNILETNWSQRLVTKLSYASSAIANLPTETIRIGEKQLPKEIFSSACAAWETNGIKR